MTESADGTPTAALQSWITTAPFEKLLGMRIVFASHGRSVMTMPFREELSQGLGYMHGGALIALADTAMAMASKGLLPPGTVFATTSIRNRFLFPVTRGMVTARAVLTGRRDRDLMGEAVLEDEAGRRVMLFSAVFRVAWKSWPDAAKIVCRELPEVFERRRDGSSVV